MITWNVKNILMTSLLLLAIIFIVLFSLFKPLRSLVPSLFQLDCQEFICIDDPALLPKARSLLQTTQLKLANKYDLKLEQVKIIFCASQTCKNTFGLANRAGYTLANWRIVIAPRAWKSHYIAHELIHYWQAQHLGVLSRYFAESWLIEGMAYSLSDDPRLKLKQPFEEYRQKFNHWYYNNRPQYQSLKALLKSQL